MGSFYRIARLCCIFVIIFSFSLGHASDLHYLIEEIKTVVDKRKESNGKLPIIVSIGGCPGVGKSTLANIFQAELKKQNIFSVIVRQDHYGLCGEERKQFANELDPRRIAWSKIHETLTDIQNGKKEITKPTINQITKERGSETLNFDNTDVVLFEGAYVLNDFSPMNYHSYADLSLYLETALENIYDWKWEREQKKPKPRTEREFFEHMKLILEDFVFHVYPSRKNADFIIQVDSFHHYSIFKNANTQRPLPDFNPIRLEMLSY